MSCNHCPPGVRCHCFTCDGCGETGTTRYAVLDAEIDAEGTVFGVVRERCAGCTAEASS